MLRITAVLAALVALGVTAAPAPAAEADSCIDVIDWWDMGERVCLDDWDCQVTLYHTTKTGTQRICVVPRLI